MKSKFVCSVLAGLLALIMLGSSGSATAAKDYLRLGFELMKSEAAGPLALGCSAGEVLGLLGAAEEQSPARVWGADGREHQQWYYSSKGVELGLVRKEDELKVDKIRITGPCDYRTRRGIGIGSTEAEVRAAYQEEIDPQVTIADRLVVGSVYGGIVFGLQNGTVSSIFVGAAAE